MIESQLNLPHIPAVQTVPDETAFNLAQVYDEELERLVSKAYSRDYINFGFKGWRS